MTTEPSGRSGHVDAALLREAAVATVRRVPRDKRIGDALPEVLRRSVYRSPERLARDEAADFERHPYTRLVAGAFAAVRDVVRTHPLWASRSAEPLPTPVYLPSRAIRERLLLMTDSGTVVIEVGDGLLLFLTKLARIVVDAQVSVGAASFRELLSLDPAAACPEPAERLRDLLAALVVCGHSGVASSAPVGEFGNTAEHLTTGMVLFLISRGLIHHLQGDRAAAAQLPAEFDGVTVCELSFSGESERQVDRLALDIMARACARLGVPNGLFTMAPFLYLAGALAAERAVARLESSSGPLEESAARGAGLPTATPARLDGLLQEARNQGRHGAIVHAHGAWVRTLVDSLSGVSQPFFDRCAELGIAARSPAAVPAYVFWLTPMARGDGGRAAIRPCYRLDDRSRVTAIHEHLHAVECLRPYVRPYEGDVVICYRSSLYRDVARRLEASLLAAGVDARYDRTLVPEGSTEWEEIIRQAIGQSRMVVMLMSLRDLGGGTTQDLSEHPVMKETKWAGEFSAPFYIAGVSHLEVHGESGALFRSFIDVLRAAADGSLVRKDFPVLMVTSESGRLPEDVEAVIARDVVEELAGLP